MRVFLYDSKCNKKLDELANHHLVLKRQLNRLKKSNAINALLTQIELYKSPKD